VQIKAWYRDCLPTCSLHVLELTVAAYVRPGSYPSGPQSAAPAQQAPYNGAQPQQPPQASQYGAAPAGFAPSQQPGADRHASETRISHDWSAEKQLALVSNMSALQSMLQSCML